MDQTKDPVSQFVFVEQDGSLFARYAPAFILEESDKSFNRIGTPTVRDDGNGKPEIYVDPIRPTIYSMEQKIKVKGGDYTNLIYRVHFEGTPFTHLTGGKNLGLLIIVTLGKDEKPLLITTVHTCGCFLAIIPTSNLSAKSYPEGWDLGGHDVFGERLPGLLEFRQPENDQDRLVFRIRSETHRIMGLDLISEEDFVSPPELVPASLRPMADLHKLPFGDSQVSFFEVEGCRKGYVRNSHKPFERMLMSWWAMDWRIGEDKDLGPSAETGTIFYTSLKFWARKKSDLWNFKDFLKYWGWKLVPLE
ncbi:MAG: hypothetical protein KKB30_09380 [Proteobacteria bacterium]|nr:hypothetical protein [Pseudomonadota bacterium]MBU1714134.1 hypothetical protein [Pseudomonadota bacterium]